MLLEIIATTADEAVTAAAHRADRIELISAFEQGGLTPTEAQIISVLDALKKLEQTQQNHNTVPKTIPVHAMIRPHSRTFVYDQADLSEMVEQITKMRSLGVHAFVLGTLHTSSIIDTNNLETLLEAAGDRPITFHRAFDETPDQEEALFMLMKYPQIKWILTSGGKPNVLDAAGQIKRLIEQSSKHDLTIMPGSGLSVASLPAFITTTGAKAAHLGTGVRTGGIHSPIDGSLVEQARGILDTFI